MRAAVSLLGLLLLSAAADARAGVVMPRLQERLAELAPGDEVSVIVRLGDRVDLSSFQDEPSGRRRALLVRALKDKAELTQGSLQVWLGQLGARRRVRLWAINAIATTLPARHVPGLAARPGVSSVDLDMKFSAPSSGSVPPASPPEWNVEEIRAPELWEMGCTGEGAVAATLDSGVDALHDDLGERWRGGDNSWFDPYGQHAAPYDHSGHGTQVMGVLLGGEAGGTNVGVAPGARWIAAKIFDDSDQATLSAIHQAYQWVLDPDADPDTDDAPDLVNNSWGLPDTIDACDSEFADDIAALHAADIPVVFAAGNFGPYSATSVSPPNDPASLSVGALDPTGNVASSSSRGPSACGGGIYPRITAPGVNIRAPDLTFNGIFPQAYLWVSGTSFAAPHVSGALALLKAALPAASAVALERALEDGALDLGAAGPDHEYGFGKLDVVEAHELLKGRVPGPRTCGREGDPDFVYSCGLGGEIAALLPLLLWLRGRPRRGHTQHRPDGSDVSRKETP